MAYPDILVLKSPLISFGGVFTSGLGNPSQTLDHIEHLTIAANVMAIYGKFINNEKGARDTRTLSAVFKHCKIGEYDISVVPEGRNKWPFWFSESYA